MYTERLHLMMKYGNLIEVYNNVDYFIITYFDVHGEDV